MQDMNDDEITSNIFILFEILRFSQDIHQLGLSQIIMSVKKLFVLLSLILWDVCGAVLTSADFLYQVSYTNSYFWNNYVGIVMNLDEVINDLNKTEFQGSILNSNLKGSWSSNFAPTLRMPKGWYYNCTLAGVDPLDPTACKLQIQGNTTFQTHVGQFIWYTASQPYWTWGINHQNLNLTLDTTKQALLGMIVRIYVATHLAIFSAEMMWEGDLAVANQMRTGTYGPAEFLEQAALYDTIVPGLPYKAPGLSQSAGADWLAIIPDFHDRVIAGIWTFQPVIFMDPSLATINNLLSDNYTKGYFDRRLRVNSTFTYTNFSQLAALERVRIVSGQGIDGVTNTFAAAVWWIDFLMEAALHGFYDVSIEAARRSGNYQSIFGQPPLFAPTSLYYGSLMAILAAEKSPRIILPTLTAGTSANIKIWSTQTALLQKFLIINKDTNSLLSGSVSIKVKADINTKLVCIYMKAPSLTSKADKMTIGGHSYVGETFIPQGSYEKTTLTYNEVIKGYSVPLGYAQVALCEMPNSNSIIPTKQCHQNHHLFVLLVVLILCILL